MVDRQQSQQPQPVPVYFAQDDRYPAIDTAVRVALFGIEWAFRGLFLIGAILAILFVGAIVSQALEIPEKDFLAIVGVSVILVALLNRNNKRQSR